MGANFGKNYKISIFGESHGSALGINIDGTPAGTELDLNFISEEMKNKIFFINGETLTSKEKSRLSKFGEILYYNTDKFSELINSFKKNFSYEQTFIKPLYLFIPDQSACPGLGFLAISL